MDFISLFITAIENNEINPQQIFLLLQYFKHLSLTKQWPGRRKSHKTIQLFLANGPVLYLILITKLDI